MRRKLYNSQYGRMNDQEIAYHRPRACRTRSAPSALYVASSLFGGSFDAVPSSSISRLSSWMPLAVCDPDRFLRTLIQTFPLLVEGASLHLPSPHTIRSNWTLHSRYSRTYSVFISLGKLTIRKGEDCVMRSKSRLRESDWWRMRRGCIVRRDCCIQMWLGYESLRRILIVNGTFSSRF